MSEKLLTDLFISSRKFGAVASDRDSVLEGDLRTVKGRDNLSQAILNRIFTRKGELKGLGHPEYGSRLYQLIGEPNNKRTRALAELYIREALEEEKRVGEIIDISVEEPTRDAGKRNMLIITLSILPLEEEEPLNISLSMNLGD